MRTRKTFWLSLSVITLCALLAGCTERSRTTAETSEMESGGAVNDATLTARVKTSFISDPQVSALRIDVDTADGIVTLTGTVNSAAEKDAAERIARATSGVLDVVNSLQVAGASESSDADLDRPAEPSGSPAASPQNNTDFTDGAITAAVKTHLAFKKDVAAHDIEIETRDGVVTLNGLVRTQAEKELAGKVAMDTAGVKRVINNLRVGRPS